MVDMTARAQTIAALQQRVHQMQGTAVSRPVPTSAALAPVLQLRSGTSYGTDSPLLAMLLMAGPSGAGAWTAVVGVPDFGLEAAQSLGVSLERTVLVPDPGESWWTVLGALAEVVGVVVVRPPSRVSPAQAERLTSRLRQRDTVLVALDDRGNGWPRVEARLTLQDTIWSGIGQGHGRITARRTTVVATQGGRRTQAELCDTGGPVPDFARTGAARSLLEPAGFPESVEPASATASSPFPEPVDAHRVDHRQWAS